MVARLEEKQLRLNQAVQKRWWQGHFSGVAEHVVDVRKRSDLHVDFQPFTAVFAKESYPFRAFLCSKSSLARADTRF